MPEWRKDPVFDRWVVIATERGKRPSDFLVPREEKKEGECPLCEGREWETPPETLAYREKDGVRDRPGWWVRVVPNKFPAVRIEGRINAGNIGVYQVMNGVGAHEVVVETPEHGTAIEDLDQYQVQEVIRAWRDRSLSLRGDTRFKYVQVFKNYGSTAGASLEHPHSQIIATPMVPLSIREKLDSLKRHAGATGRCIICDMIAQELNEQNRVVAENDRFLCVTPFASRFPFESWIMPKEHQPDFACIREDQVADLAFVMRTVLKKLSAALRRPPYNMVISTAPVNEDGEDMIHFHWHMEILPRLTTAAGFELGTGFYINPTPPEMAASALRETVAVYEGGYRRDKYEGVGRYV